MANSSRPKPACCGWRAWARWAALFAHSAAIFFASSRSSFPISVPAFPHADKVGHALVYAVWGALCAFALDGSARRLGAVTLILLSTAAGALYGASDEFHQSFVPGRDVDGLDLLADTVGACVGASIVVLRRGTRRLL